MKKIISSVFIVFVCCSLYSQRMLTSWGQNSIENYTKEMYDHAQTLTTSELLIKNQQDRSWSEVFLTLNASVNNYRKDKDYLKELANQIPNNKITKLEGTSRLIIWDRIISGDIIFEGKGLVIDDDLFQVGGRANVLLQNLTEKNFGHVTVHSTTKELEELKNKWLDYLAGKPVEEYVPMSYANAKIPEISSLNAVEALIVSLQDNPAKDRITKKCLKNVYNLDELPKDKNSSANYCNPDTYTFAYLAMLFDDEKIDEAKDADWWKKFWTENHNKLVWNDTKGIYEIKN